MIDGHCLTFAAEGHIERMRPPVPMVLDDLAVDSVELLALVQELIRQRECGTGDLAIRYGGGFIDGFVIGVRAAREAARVEDL